MKIQVNNKLFYLVITLLLILPLGRHLDLFLFGERTEGVADHLTYVDFAGDGRGTFTSMVFKFDAENRSYTIEGPVNVKYLFDEKCKIIYKKGNPLNCIIPTFTYLYLSPQASISFFILIVWIAFYTSFWQGKRPEQTEVQNIDIS